MTIVLFFFEFNIPNISLVLVIPPFLGLPGLPKLLFVLPILFYPLNILGTLYKGGTGKNVVYRCFKFPLEGELLLLF